jgi:hypothetical protein
MPHMDIQVVSRVTCQVSRSFLLLCQGGNFSFLSALVGNGAKQIGGSCQVMGY